MGAELQWWQGESYASRKRKPSMHRKSGFTRRLYARTTATEHYQFVAGVFGVEGAKFPHAGL